MDPVAAVGNPAPDFVLRDLDGKAFRLSDQRGKILVLNFWSADCPHCERTDQLLASLRAAWADQVQAWWIAPNANEADGSLRQAALQRRIAPVLRDAEQSVADRYGAQTTPHVFVVDEHGVVRYAGAPDDVSFRQRLATRNYLAEAVEALRRGQAPQPDSTTPYGCAIVRTPAARRSTHP